MELDFGRDDVMTAKKFDQYCADILLGFHFRYAIDDKEREVLNEKLHIASHRVLHFLDTVLVERPGAFGSDQLLALVLNVRVRLFRILAALRHLGSVKLLSE